MVQPVPVRANGVGDDDDSHWRSVTSPPDQVLNVLANQEVTVLNVAEKLSLGGVTQGGMSLHHLL